MTTKNEKESQQLRMRERKKKKRYRRRGCRYQSNTMKGGKIVTMETSQPNQRTCDLLMTSCNTIQ